MNGKIIGNTPMVQVSSVNNNYVYCKLEGCNFYGSAKDRAALYVLTKLLEDGIINSDTEIIESSSGNMGVALSAVCSQMNLKVTIVIDAATSPVNEFLIRSYGANVVKITKADENGSYLVARLEYLNNYVASNKNVYWFNQYGNDYVCEAYRETVGKEIVKDIPDVDYVFVAISSGGTINGISQALKEHNSNIKVIAVDCEGSKIFDQCTTKKRHLTGIGSSIITDNVKKAVFDDHIIISEDRAVEELKELLNKEQIFAGGSSGCVYAGAKEYLKVKNISDKKVVCLFHDRGDRYYEKIYKNFL